MEFKLNKVDTDIINRIKESTKEDKVHQNDTADVNNKVKDRKTKREIEDKENYPCRKRFVTIDSTRHNNSNKVEISAERVENFTFEKSRGYVLDTKK